MNYINSVIKITNKPVYEAIREKCYQMEKTSNGEKKIKPTYEDVIQSLIEELISLRKKK